MKINRNRIVSSCGDTFGHFLLGAMTVVMDKGIDVPNPEEYDVTMTINGVDIPVEEVFMYWHDKIESSVESRANKLFLNRFKDVKEIFGSLHESINEKVNEAKGQVVNKLDLWDEFEPRDIWD